jgi:predicted NBD/HSP70 family sugar kinase
MRVGLDIGATKVLGAVIEADGTVVAQSRRNTLPGADGILDTAATVLDSLAIALDGVLPSHIGIGIPGHGRVDRQAEHPDRVGHPRREAVTGRDRFRVSRSSRGEEGHGWRPLPRGRPGGGQGGT